MLRCVRRSLPWLGVVSSLLAARGAAAQAPPVAPVQPGAAATERDQPAAPGPAPAAAPRPFVRVVLKSGPEVEGWIASRTAEALVLDLPGGGQMTVTMPAVASVTERKDVGVRPSGEVWPEDRNRTHYLEVPSAFMLRAGEGYFGQKQLLFSEVGYGLTDWLTASAGGAVPFWFVSEGFNAFAGLKLGFSLGELVHLSGSGSIWFVPGGSGAFGLLYATATVGTPNAHVSAAAGWPYLLSSTGEDVGSALFILAANLRVSRTVALVTENWFFPDAASWDGEFPMVNALAVRFFGERIAVDVGLVRVAGVSFPPPWLGFIYNFGG